MSIDPRCVTGAYVTDGRRLCYVMVKDDHFAWLENCATLVRSCIKLVDLRKPGWELVRAARDEFGEAA